MYKYEISPKYQFFQVVYTSEMTSFILQTVIGGLVRDKSKIRTPDRDGVCFPVFFLLVHAGPYKKVN